MLVWVQELVLGKPGLGRLVLSTLRETEGGFAQEERLAVEVCFLSRTWVIGKVSFASGSPGSRRSAAHREVAGSRTLRQ